MARAVKALKAIDAVKPSSANYHAHALARGLGLLELLAEGPQPRTLTEFHEATALPKSTLVRLLSVLGELEYVVRVDERPSFRLGHKVLHLSTAYVANLDLSVNAGPYLRELAEAAGQTANLGVLDGSQVLHSCVVEPDRPIRFTATTGSRDATHCTALGKMLLTGVPADQLAEHVGPEPFPGRTDKTITTLDDLARDVRRAARRGFAYDDNEGAAGLRCLAVPVEVDGVLVAALSVSGPSGEMIPDRHKEYLHHLLAVAGQLAADPDVVAALRIVHRSLRPAEGRSRQQ